MINHFTRGTDSLFFFSVYVYSQAPFLNTDTEKNTIYMLHDKGAEMFPYPSACIPIVITQLILL